MRGKLSAIGRRTAGHARRRDKLVGRSVTRLEDRPLLLPAAAALPPMSRSLGQLHMRVVRSTYANAGFCRSTPRARDTPGVHAVWTAADVADIPPIDFRLTQDRGMDAYRQRVLAQRPGAICRRPGRGGVCRDPYLAEDAADLVVLELSRNCRRCSRRASAGRIRAGPLDRGAVSPQGVRRRRCGLPQRACDGVARALASGAIPACRWRRAARSARYDGARDMLELHGAAKVPHWNRDQIAGMLGLPPSRVHLYEGHVGGGFGIRGELYPEDVLVCAAALRFRRPVKWIEDRREHLIAANHSRQQLHRIRAAIDARRPHPRHRRRILPRPGRLCAHARGHRARPCRGHAAGPVPRSGLSRGRPHPADQQDAGRHLSRAGPVRKHVRARTAAGCDCREGRNRRRRGAAPQSDRQGRDAL